MAFKEAKHESAYLKMGMYGEMGTGKTHTACAIAIGLHKLLKMEEPVFFVDSEKGSDFHVKRFREAGIQLQVDKTRVFATLLADVEIAASRRSILIVDSISHFWIELMAAYRRKKNRKFLSLYDFGPLKEEWSKYNSLYVNSPLHIIECGRSSDITITEVVSDEEGGSERERIQKVGTKMAAEKNTAYEPDLLVEMERDLLHSGGLYAIKATVLKERYGVIMGEQFINPTFEHFLPYIKELNLGGEHVGVRIEEGSEGMFESPDRSVTERRKLQQVIMEEIGAVKSTYITASSRDKMLWNVALDVAFGTASETAIADKHPGVLRSGRDLLIYLIPWEQELEEQPKNVKALRGILTDEAERWREEQDASTAETPKEDLLSGVAGSSD